MSDRPADDPRRRRVRSFVLRGGRLTDAQQRAMDTLYPRYGVEPVDTVIDPAALFGRTAPLVADIGFGNGEATWRMARDEPDKNFLGIEVHPPGVGHLLLKLDELGIDNVRVARADAVELLTHRLPDASLAEVRLYFPDPWPKKRHHKRRIVQPDFLQLVARRLQPGGLLHMATDWQPYADWMLEMCQAEPLFRNTSATGSWVPQPAWRPTTKYERRGERLGHEVRDLLFERVERVG